MAEREIKGKKKNLNFWIKKKKTLSLLFKIQNILLEGAFCFFNANGGGKKNK